ncbi:NAD(P)/FAD-dependent oxidoreductase [Zongyangia hominis]|uniref:FAD-dependent oxidoreductase n=1 Tax=Zongyangia hominis TaxID=2763677 RepID=A0A926I9U1_9FIRM|nr:FAD-dependent oxidoreductase [Zongyangia hominis]MBC8569521.1 FAD-dependent oxidoreductase [Zongyangia hominis]
MDTGKRKGQSPLTHTEIDYDVAIIGGGIGGIMTAYELIENRPDLRVCIIEKGHGIEKRTCPIVTKAVDKCINCPSCAIMEGMAGAGAFSDGKYVISTEYGGWLTEFLSPETVISYIEKADAILVSFGATTERFMPNDDLKKLCLQYDLHMSQAQLKHLGTDANFDTMKKLIASLRGRCDVLTDTEVTGVDRESHVLTLRSKAETRTIAAEKIVFAVGRAGSRYFAAWCKENGIPLQNNQVDIGVRVELPYLVWEDFSKKIYEPKIWYRSKVYGDTTRMFCFNERGNVVTENTSGVLTVNGHSYRDMARKTENSNFALLSTIKFTEPFKEPIEYARHVASLANLISGGSVLVQRLGDLENGRRTDEGRLRKSTTRPTLHAVPGDLSLCLPKRQLDNIIETLHALDHVAPGTANYDTLLYGIECKYYSARPDAVNFEITGCKGIYAIGDGAGFTRSLSQAAANGLYVADQMLAK